MDYTKKAPVTVTGGGGPTDNRTNLGMPQGSCEAVWEPEAERLFGASGFGTPQGSDDGA